MTVVTSENNETTVLHACRNDLLLRALKREHTPRPPVWLMRQAGRCDPEYRRIREESGLPLEAVFRDADLAAQLTILPKRLGVDALIIFQDILTPLDPMGMNFVFRPGPVLDRPIRSRSHIEKLQSFDPADDLAFFGKSIRTVLNEIDGELPLLGFAGSPFTLAAFAIEGKSPGGSLNHTKQMMKDDPQLLHALLGQLADMTATYLNYQIEQGVHAVQIFESVADLLTLEEYTEFAHPYHQRVIEQTNTEQAPIILFAKEQPAVELMVNSGADAISIGKCVDLEEVCQTYGDRVAVQGNVDNELLRSGTPEELRAAVETCIKQGNCKGHILNLNHGVFRDTPIENVQLMIESCRSWKPTTTHDTTIDRKKVDDEYATAS